MLPCRTQPQHFQSLEQLELKDLFLGQWQGPVQDIGGDRPACFASIDHVEEEDPKTISDPCEAQWTGQLVPNAC